MPDALSAGRRPLLHLTPPEGWVNDPLGLTYRPGRPGRPGDAGRYHLFFQHVPGQVVWGPDCRWGHATSEDLLTWTHQPVALSPGDGDDGCWSGSIVAPPGEPASLFYTSVGLDDLAIGRVRVARPDDAEWAAWTKQDRVVAELPDGVAAVAYRDPFVLHDGERWRMLMGAGLEDGTATALVHSSDDLREWTFSGPLLERHTSVTERLWTGPVWECPQLFPLEDRWVLTVSVWEAEVPQHEVYAVGSYADGRFTPDSWGRLTYGPSSYAASAFTDAEGRRGLVSWLRGVEDEAGRWAGAHSLPQVLGLRGDTLLVEPHPNLAARRSGAVPLVPGQEAALPATVDVEWRPGGDDRLVLRSAGDGAEVLALAVRDGEVTATTPSGRWAMPLDGDRLRVVVDVQVAEVFTGTATMALPLASVDSLLATLDHGRAVAHDVSTPVSASG